MDEGHHGHSGLKFLPTEKANAIAEYLENCSHHVTCVTNTMNGGRRLVFNLCLKSKREPPPPKKESDLVRYKINTHLEIKKGLWN
jgi:hypothetical protein